MRVAFSADVFRRSSRVTARARGYNAGCADKHLVTATPRQYVVKHEKKTFTGEGGKKAYKHFEELPNVA